MKKNLWFVFVALAMVAIFTVAGCKPTTPTTPTPTPTATPTPTPTPVPDYCPEVEKVVAYDLYSNELGVVTRIVIYLDQPIDPILNAVVDNPDCWEVELTNASRVDDAAVDIEILDVAPTSNLEAIVIDAIVTEEFENGIYQGLICSEDEAEEYADLSGEEAPNFSDNIAVTSTCVVFDEFGNNCCDTVLTGDVCCAVQCPECEEGCPIGTVCD